MSAEGLIAGHRPEAEGADRANVRPAGSMPPVGCHHDGADCGAAVLDDVLAYIQRRRDNAALIANRSPEFAEWAKDRQRQLEIVADELRAGLHVGCAAVLAQLAGDNQTDGES